MGSETVNDKWNMFTASLDLLFRTGFQEAHDLGYVTDLELAKALNAPGRSAGPTATGSMQQRKLRRRLAQLYELRRLICCANTDLSCKRTRLPNCCSGVLLIAQACCPVFFMHLMNPKTAFLVSTRSPTNHSPTVGSSHEG